MYLKLKINNLTFLELYLIIFTLISFVMFLQVVIGDFILSLDILDKNYNSHYLGDDNTASSNPSASSSNLTSSTKNESMGKAITETINGTIMTVALTAGMKLSQTTPTLAGKIGALAPPVGGRGVALGGSAIIVKNVSGNVSKDLGKSSNNLLPMSGEGTNLNEVLAQVFNLTGNYALDLLTLIQVFQKLQLMFIVLIIYNLLLYLINVDNLEKLLLKIFPSKLVNYYLKSVNFVKKSSLIIIIFFLILLLISNLYAYHYLNFFISNLDAIIDFYFKK